jgi:hypothetical protein
MNSPEALATVEGALASHRGFGDSDYINGQMHVVFKQRLHRIGSRLPAARELLAVLNDSDADTVGRVMCDTVLRCAIQHALWGIELDWQGGLTRNRCAELLQEATALLERGYREAPLRAPVDLLVSGYRFIPAGSGATNTSMIHFAERFAS